MKRLLALFVAVCLAQPAFSQGMYWKSKQEGTVGEKITEGFMIPKMYKSVEHGRDSSITIIRLDKEVIWRIHPAKKTYSETTFAQLEALTKKAAGKMDDAMAKMREQMQGMSEEQKKMMEKMMGSKMPGGGGDGALEVRRTSEKKTISGFGCTKYVGKQGEEEFMTLWTTKDVDGFDALKADWKAFSRRWAALIPRIGKGLAEAYDTVEGFPVQTTMTLMNHTVTTTVTKVERRATPAREFEVPAGYQQVKSDLEEAMQKMDEE